MPVKPTPITIEFEPHATLSDLAEAVATLREDSGDPNAVVRATTGISFNRHGGPLLSVTVHPHDTSYQRNAA